VADGVHSAEYPGRLPDRTAAVGEAIRALVLTLSDAVLDETQQRARATLSRVLRFNRIEHAREFVGLGNRVSASRGGHARV